VSIHTSIYYSFSISFLLLFSYTAAAQEAQSASESAGTRSARGHQEQQVKDTDGTMEGFSNQRDPVDTTPGPRSFLRTFVADQKVIWTAPSRVARGNLKWLVPAVVGAGVAIATDNRLSEQIPNPDDPARVVGRNVSHVGALYTLAGISGGTYLFGRIAGKDRLRDTGWLGLEALAHSQIVVQGMKLVTQRERPPEIAERRGFWKGGSSFPSGHAASSWAFATVVAREYRDKKVVPIVAYSLAGIVSAARLSARRHYASDILVGGVVGHLIGRYIHDSHADPALGSSRSALLTPRVGVVYSRPARHYALNLSWHF
jgi:membrane-associated phospholipid phosphatase